MNNKKDIKYVTLKKSDLAIRNIIMKNQVIKEQKNVGAIVKKVTLSLLCITLGCTSTYATRTVASSAGQEKNKEQATLQHSATTQAPVTADKLKTLCDKLGSISESTLQRYAELKHTKDELYKVLKDNPQRDLIFKDGRIECITLKGIVDSLPKDQITQVYQILAPCEKLKEKKLKNIRKSVNEIRKAHGDTNELQSIDNEIQVIESSFVDFDKALQRLDAHEEGMRSIRGGSAEGQKKGTGLLDTAKQKISGAFEKTKEFFVDSEKGASRSTKQDRQHYDKKSDVEGKVRSDDHTRDTAHYASEIIAQHEDLVEKTVEEAHRDIEELSHEVVELRKDAVDLYRQAIEKEVLAQQKAFEKAALLREQSEQLAQEAEFLLKQAEELEKRSREGV
jgi:hypothetical protein